MLPWHGFWYLNPPYGKSLIDWLARATLFPNGIAFVFARTETKAFFRYVWPCASALLFVRGRVTFHYPHGGSPKAGHNSGGPSVAIGYGGLARQRLMTCADLGAVVTIASRVP